MAQIFRVVFIFCGDLLDQLPQCFQTFFLFFFAREQFFVTSGMLAMSSWLPMVV